jgi:hypothetical protein
VPFPKTNIHPFTIHSKHSEAETVVNSTYELLTSCKEIIFFILRMFEIHKYALWAGNEAGLLIDKAVVTYIYH